MSSRLTIVQPVCYDWSLLYKRKSIWIKKNIPSEWLEESDFSILIHLCKWSQENSRKRGRKCPSNLKSKVYNGKEPGV